MTFALFERHWRLYATLLAKSSSLLEITTYGFGDGRPLTRCRAHRRVDGVGIHAKRSVCRCRASTVVAEVRTRIWTLGTKAAAIPWKNFKLCWTCAKTSASQQGPCPSGVLSSFLCTHGITSESFGCCCDSSVLMASQVSHSGLVVIPLLFACTASPCSAFGSYVVASLPHVPHEL